MRKRGDIELREILFWIMVAIFLFVILYLFITGRAFK